MARVGAVLLAVGLLVAIAIAALHTPPGRRLVLSRVTDILAAQDIRLQTDELRFNLLTLSLSLRNVLIQAVHAADAPPVARVERAEMDLSLLQILRGRVVVHSGQVDGIDVYYQIDERGADNLPHPPRDPDQPSEPLDLVIMDLAVSNARVRYEDRGQEIDAVLPISSVSVTGSDVTNRHDVRVEAGDGVVRAQGRTLHIDRLTGAVELEDDAVRIRRVEVEGDGSRVSINGVVTRLAEPQLNVNVGGQFDLSRAATVAAFDEQIAGLVDFKAAVSGSLASPTIMGRAEASEVAVRGVRDLNLVASAMYETSAERLSIESFEAQAPWGVVTGSASVSFDETAPSQVRAAVTKLDTAALMRALNLATSVESIADGQAELEWPGLSVAETTGTATLTLKPARAASHSSIPVGGRIDVIADARQADVLVRSLRAGGVETAGRVTLVDQERVQGILRSRADDLGTTLSTLETFLGRPHGSLLSDSTAGPLVVETTIGGTVALPVLTSVVSAPSLTVNRTGDINLAADIRFTPDALTVSRFDASWLQARAHAAATIALHQPRRLQLTANVENLDIRSILDVMNRTDVPASGTVGFQASVAGTVDEPIGSVVINGSGLTAYQEVLGSLAAETRLAGGEAAVFKVRIDKPQPQGDGLVQANGTYSLTDRTHTLELDTENVRLTSFTMPDGRALRGGFDLHAESSGLLDAPSAHVEFNGQDFEFADRLLGPLAATVDVAGRAATISAKAEQFALTANATVAIESPYSAAITAQLNDLDLRAIPIQLDTPLAGRVRAMVDLNGELANPSSLEANGTIQELAGTWNNQPFSVEGPAALRYVDERLTIDKLRLTAQDSSFTLSGTLPLTETAGPGTLDLEAEANLGTLASYAPASLSISAEGDVRLDGTITGTLERIDPDLVVTIDNGLILSREIEPGLTELTLRARVSKGEAAIEQLSAGWGAASISATATIPLEALPELPIDLPRRGGPATIEASVEGLNPAAIPGAPAGLGGQLALNAKMSAARPDLTALEGRIEFPTLDLSLNGLTLAQQEASSIAIANGAVQVEQFDLSGTLGTLRATGQAELIEPRRLDLGVNGDLNVGAVSILTDAATAEGTATLDVVARGTLDDPEFSGSVELSDTSFALDEPRIAGEELSARASLEGRRIVLTGLNGNINGGVLTGDGEITLAEGGGLDTINLGFAMDDFAFDAPLELRSLSDSAIHITSDRDELLVSGKVTITEAGLTGDIDFDTGLIAALSERRKLDLTEQRSDLLERVRFNVQVQTATPVIVDNNLAQAEVEADVRVLGTPYETGLSGRLTVVEGSVVTLNERRYETERAIITFLEERRIFPSFDLVLNTTARNYDVRVAVTGSPGDTETSLTSSPELPEPDIMALLVTGRTLDEMRGEEFEVAQEQVMSRLAGRVGSSLGEGIESATGLTEVRLEPTLIASEADPSARLTVGQELADGLELVYSTDLANSNDQIWMAEYDVTRRFSTRAVRQSDNSYRVDLRHELGLGGQPPPRRMERTRPDIVQITITGQEPAEDAQVRRLLGVEEGDSYDFFKLREAAEEIAGFYVERGFVQARVRLDRQVDESGAVLHVEIERGPLVEVRFEGMALPSNVREDVRTQWQRGIFDIQRTDDGEEVIRSWLTTNRYFQGTVESSIEESADARRLVVFRIDPGPRFQRVVLAFEGAAQIEPDELNEIVKSQELEEKLFTDPVVVTELLEKYYNEEGFLAAEIDEPRYEYQGSLARVVLPISEGPLFHVRNMSTSGNAAIGSPVLLSVIPIASGDPFRPAAAENALQSLRDTYWKRGYNDVRVDYSLVVDRFDGSVDVDFSVHEGLESVIADIIIDGNEKASDRMILEQLELLPNETLDLSALSRSRRNLYDTGAFSIVDITRQDLEGDVPASALGWQESTREENQKPVRLNVHVREVQPIQLNYGASYDSERGVGGVFEISNHNSLGKARVIGLATRYDSELREMRGSISQPSLRYWPIQTTGTIFYREEHNPETELTDAFDINRRGVSIQQERELRNAYVWTYGYRYERTRTTGLLNEGAAVVDGEALVQSAGAGGAAEIVDVSDRPMTVSPLTSTLTREARDEVLDATRGSFTSHAFSYSPGWLGADRPFVKYFGQYFHYFPLRPPQRKPFTSELLRPRLVFATGVRVGLSRGIGGSVPVSERFFAGGSTTLRGFAQNAVGPITGTRIPLGGEALLVLNNELRFPMFWIVDGVAFTDIGAVFDDVRDLSGRDVRESAGFGLRLRTPWFLLRGDYGFVLDRRPDESRSRLYFSIGQAF